MHHSVGQRHVFLLPAWCPVYPHQLEEMCGSVDLFRNTQPTYSEHNCPGSEEADDSRMTRIRTLVPYISPPAWHSAARPLLTTCGMLSRYVTRQVHEMANGQRWTSRAQNAETFTVAGRRGLGTGRLTGAILMRGPFH